MTQEEEPPFLGEIALLIDGYRRFSVIFTISRALVRATDSLNASVATEGSLTSRRPPAPAASRANGAGSIRAAILSRKVVMSSP